MFWDAEEKCSKRWWEENFQSERPPQRFTLHTGIVWLALLSLPLLSECELLRSRTQYSGHYTLCVLLFSIQLHVILFLKAFSITHSLLDVIMADSKSSSLPVFWYSLIVNEVINLHFKCVFFPHYYLLKVFSHTFWFHLEWRGKEKLSWKLSNTWETENNIVGRDLSLIILVKWTNTALPVWW